MRLAKRIALATLCGVGAANIAYYLIYPDWWFANTVGVLAVILARLSFGGHDEA